MTDKPVMSDKTKTDHPKERPLPRRPGDERLVETIEKWANSSGLQKPT